MKTVKAKQTFKSVSQKQVDLNPALADRLGKKRPVVEFDLPEYEIADLPALVAENGSVMLTCLNNALSQLAKEQFAANPTDWTFLPSVESLSLASLAASFESVSRGRALTLESAGKLAAWLGYNLKPVVEGIQAVDPDYKPAQAQAIIAVVAKYTAYEAKGADYLAKVLLRLEQIAEAIGSNDELAVSFSEDSSLVATFDALVRKFSKSAEDEISEDAL